MGQHNKCGRRCLLGLAASAALLQTGTAHAVEADADAVGFKDSGGTGVRLPSVIVTGKRASLMTAQEIKRERLEIVDAVIADDIARLPDFSVSEALQRIPGIQIARDRGEGTGVVIRGLSQMETTLNGREVFTAGTGRTLDFADFPAEMVSAIQVYKTSSADHIEGGLGGTIDLRTRRPFDFAGREIAASARLVHGDLVNETKPQFSLLASNRWKIEGNGEFGALLALSSQQRAWREDQKSAGNPVARTDIISRQTVIVPNGTTESASLGERRRNGADLVLQWRPARNLELYAEGSYAEFRTRQDTQQINITPSSTFAAGSATLFPGTNDLRSITWTNAPVSILSFARDTVDRTRQFALGGSWKRDALKLSTDLSYTTSFNNLFFSGPTLGGRVASFTQNLSSNPPGTSIAGTDLLNPANLQFASIAYRTRPFRGDLTAARVDGEVQLNGSFFDAIAGGVRLARRRADDEPNLVFADATVSGIPASSMPGYVMSNPYAPILAGKSTSIGNFLVSDLSTARDPVGLRQAFGITAPIPVSGNPLGIWRINEDTHSAYVMTRFGGNNTLDGNAGVRVVRTSESVSGNQSAPSTGGVVPINVDTSYTDILPSINLRYRLREGLYVRGAASKSVTRPTFDQLSPSVTLIPNSVNPAQNQGSAGNPALRPIRANNFDIAVERYFNPVTSVFADAFVKKVDGFVTTVSSPEIYNGAVYQINRPQNTDAADIKGIELGYQQFFDFLPGWMRGLGLQFNYTYIDSRTPSTIVGGNAPLQNLSKNSANIVGMYERGKVSARIAYSWRDRFLSGVQNVVGVGALPIYTDAYGWLDASLTYRIDDKTSIAVEGTNLLNTMRTSYYGVATRPQSAWLNDRQVSIVATIRF